MVVLSTRSLQLSRSRMQQSQHQLLKPADVTAAIGDSHTAISAAVQHAGLPSYSLPR